MTCPACGRPLVLELGRVRRHHAAHAVDASCVATEAALRLDVKLAVAAMHDAGVVVVDGLRVYRADALAQARRLRAAEIARRMAERVMALRRP